MAFKFNYQSDNLVAITALKRQDNGALLTTATVHADVQNPDTLVSYGTFDLAYQGAPGTYLGVALKELALPPDGTVLMILTADDGPGLRHYWAIPVSMTISTK